LSKTLTSIGQNKNVLVKLKITILVKPVRLTKNVTFPKPVKFEPTLPNYFLDFCRRAPSILYVFTRVFTMTEVRSQYSNTSPGIYGHLMTGNRNYYTTMPTSSTAFHSLSEHWWLIASYFNCSCFHAWGEIGGKIEKTAHSAYK
jgi:hypothetical protein